MDKLVPAVFTDMNINNPHDKELYSPHSSSRGASCVPHLSFAFLKGTGILSPYPRPQSTDV